MTDRAREARAALVELVETIEQAFPALAHQPPLVRARAAIEALDTSRAVDEPTFKAEPMNADKRLERIARRLAVDEPTEAMVEAGCKAIPFEAHPSLIRNIYNAMRAAQGERG